MGSIESTVRVVGGDHLLQGGVCRIRRTSTDRSRANGPDATVEIGLAKSQLDRFRHGQTRGCGWERLVELTRHGEGS